MNDPALNIPLRRRNNMLMICDGVPTLAILMEHVNRHRRVDDILHWCISNKQIGRKLLATFEQDCACSPLLFIKKVVAKIENESSLRPIMAGRDYA